MDIDSIQYKCQTLSVLQPLALKFKFSFSSHLSWYLRTMLILWGFSTEVNGKTVLWIVYAIN